MFDVCRPMGRLFYWVLAVVVVMASSALVSAREEASEGKPASSPTAKPRAAGVSPRAASPTPQSGPALTSVIDTVYMANGCLNASTWCKQPASPNIPPAA